MTSVPVRSESTPSETPPTVSIITVNLDNVSGLLRTAASIWMQGAGPDGRLSLEWIVIDGGSVDGSASLLREWMDQPGRLTSFVSEPDRGIYDAMNKGIALSRGRYLVFLNSGDAFCHRHVVTSAVSRLERSGCSWGYGCLRVMEGHAPRPRHAVVFAPFRLGDIALGRRTIPHQATFMARDLLLHLDGFDPRAGIAADQELLLRASLVEEPDVWLEFMVDFESGGVGSSRGFADYPRDMYRARRRLDLRLGGGRVSDALVTAAFVAQRSFVHSRGTIVRRLGQRLLRAGAGP